MAEIVQLALQITAIICAASISFVMLFLVGLLGKACYETFRGK